SQQRTAAAQAAGRFDDEIAPITTRMLKQDKATGETSELEVTFAVDECNRPGTTLEALLALPPVIEGGCVTAGNSSQLSDGASACVVMDSAVASREGVPVLGVFRGFAAIGCEPDEM